MAGQNGSVDRRVERIHTGRAPYEALVMSSPVDRTDGSWTWVRVNVSAPKVVVRLPKGAYALTALISATGTDRVRTEPTLQSRPRMLLDEDRAVSLVLRGADAPPGAGQRLPVLHPQHPDTAAGRRLRPGHGPALRTPGGPQAGAAPTPTTTSTTTGR
ncbi:hypothetical protein ACFXDH_53825 [Streptomyces sp. NPDC059467]|uniref:hypothetical protein n=1 Tax=Streptomyces sp. NPDC059467 TaxID=3346844 RepID=UPI0036A2E125